MGANNTITTASSSSSGAPQRPTSFLTRNTCSYYSYLHNYIYVVCTRPNDNNNCLYLCMFSCACSLLWTDPSLSLSLRWARSNYQHTLSTHLACADVHAYSPHMHFVLCLIVASDMCLAVCACHCVSCILPLWLCLECIYISSTDIVRHHACSP